MSAKDCGHHGESRRRKIAGAGVVFVIVTLVIIFLVWVILRPTKPTFILQDATVFNLSISTTPSSFLTTTIAITLYSRNPNRRIGVYYDQLQVFAVYHGQQLTLPTAIPTAFQDHRDVNVWSPLLYGAAVPVAPYNGAALSQDQAAGMVFLIFKLQGRVRWKVGAFISGYYHLHVSCPAFIALSGKASAAALPVAGGALRYQLVQSCSVSV